MRKMTLLEMTQNILSSMNSDEVNSIGDTVESLQVAEEIRNTFYDLFSNRDIPEFEGLVTLQALSDPLKPNLMVLPDNVQHIKWLKYRNHRAHNLKYDEVEYLHPEEFIRRIIEMDNGSTIPYVEVPILTNSTNTYFIQANKRPDFYTVLDNDKTLVFDSYDAEEESFLTANNSLAWGVHAQQFDLTDEYIAPIDANLFPLFLSEAKAACFINVKEVSNSMEERRARRQLVRSQTRMVKTPGQYEGVFDAHDYSRKRARGGRYRRYHSRWS